MFEQDIEMPKEVVRALRTAWVSGNKEDIQRINNLWVGVHNAISS